MLTMWCRPCEIRYIIGSRKPIDGLAASKGANVQCIRLSKGKQRLAEYPVKQGYAKACTASKQGMVSSGGQSIQ